MGRRTKEPKRPPGPIGLRPYPEIVDTAHVQGWKVELDYHKGVWTLEVRDRAELIAKSRCGMGAPLAFPLLGRDVKESLEKSGRV